MRAKVLPENPLGPLGDIRRLIPGTSRVNIISLWSGVESYFPGSIPVMEPSVTTPGLFYTFGLGGADSQVGPGVGHVMAELIATGTTTTTPVASYSIARFGTP
jgi:sarcosine oxidase, subunit beta